MYAQILKDIGQLEYCETEKPKLSFNDVLVEVKATGICGSDIPRIYKTGAHNMPLIPGHEFSGKVVCAPGVGARWNGKRVGVFPLIPCRQCPQCLEKKYEMCRHYDYLGSRSDGAFAEYVKVPRLNLIELPDNVSYESAAMLEPMAVAAHAMRNVSPKDDDKICVCGLGTIGLLLVMLLVNEYDAQNIFVIGNKDFQKEMAVKIGISEENYCDIKTNDASLWISEKIPAGPDVFFECVGKNETVSLAVDVTAPGGRVQLVGNPASDMTFEKNIYWKILRNQLTVLGTWNSSFTKAEDDDWHYCLDMIGSGRVNPSMLITHKFTLDKLEDGLAIMRDKTEDYVKIMTTFEK